MAVYECFRCRIKAYTRRVWRINYCVVLSAHFRENVEETVWRSGTEILYTGR